MTRNKAIEILSQQIEKLKSSKASRTQSWTIETRTYIISFFGEESYQNGYFHYFSWDNEMGKNLDQQENDTINFLQDCISTIKNIGLFKKPRANFLSQLSDGIVVLILTVIATVSFGIGKYFSDVQNIELRRENTELKKTIRENQP